MCKEVRVICYRCRMHKKALILGMVSFSYAVSIMKGRQKKKNGSHKGSVEFYTIFLFEMCTKMPELR